jgi:hypothetical protein
VGIIHTWQQSRKNDRKINSTCDIIIGRNYVWWHVNVESYNVFVFPFPNVSISQFFKNQITVSSSSSYANVLTSKYRILKSLRKISMLNLIGFSLLTMDSVPYRGLFQTFFILNYVLLCQLVIIQPFVSASGIPSFLSNHFFFFVFSLNPILI